MYVVIPCKDCDGTGRMPANPTWRCFTCEGEQEALYNFLARVQGVWYS